MKSNETPRMRLDRLRVSKTMMTKIKRDKKRYCRKSKHKGRDFEWRNWKRFFKTSKTIKN